MDGPPSVGVSGARRNWAAIRQTYLCVRVSTGAISTGPAMIVWPYNQAEFHPQSAAMDTNLAPCEQLCNSNQRVGKSINLNVGDILRRSEHGRYIINFSVNVGKFSSGPKNWLAASVLLSSIGWRLICRGDWGRHLSVPACVAVR